ncbi:MAG TPA: oxidoreductase [Anaerolineae bacterium]|nr:oxidoreductase [Anaerolineae bacterium]HCR71599.1 oxidoreductase [Anaerolineae bacterium]
MGFFDKILEKIGIKKKDEKEVGGEAKGGLKAKDDVAKKPGVGANAPARTVPQQAGVVKPAAMSEVDVVAKLEGLAKGKDLNWKVSIVDLLKLLDLDSSREAREELAKELNAPADVTGDSARLNVWLHKEVLRKIAANGGNIPADLLD